MKPKSWVRGSCVLFCVLAGGGPAWEVARVFQARELARTFTKYGPLPEIPITAFDYMTLVLALVLVGAACLEALGLRGAALVAFAATAGLWVYYGPGAWEKITGDMRFSVKLGHNIAVSWRMIAYQMAATISAGALSYMRWREQR